MRWCDFIVLLGAATAWPLRTLAREANGTRRIAVMLLNRDGDSVGQKRLAALEQELEKRGWIVAKLRREHAENCGIEGHVVASSR